MSRAHKIIDAAATVLGTVIVFLGVVLISDVHLQARILVVLVGVLIIEVGVWKLASPFLRKDRPYTGLRHEVDSFLGQVRSLNQATLEARGAGTDESWSRVEEVKEGLLASVERMAEVAGKAEGQD